MGLQHPEQELGCSRALGLSAWQGAQVGTQRGAGAVHGVRAVGTWSTAAGTLPAGARSTPPAPSFGVRCWCFPAPPSHFRQDGVSNRNRSHFQQVMAGSCGAVVRGDVPMQPRGAGTARRLSPRPALASQGTGSPRLQKIANAKILTEIKPF